MTNPPCKNCQDRSVSCHSSCSLYLTWKSEHEKQKENERKQKELERVGIWSNYLRRRRK